MDQLGNEARKSLEVLLSTQRPEEKSLTNGLLHYLQVWLEQNQPENNEDDEEMEEEQEEDLEE